MIVTLNLQISISLLLFVPFNMQIFTKTLIVREVELSPSVVEEAEVQRKKVT